MPTSKAKGQDSISGYNNIHFVALSTCELLTSLTNRKEVPIGTPSSCPAGKRTRVQLHESHRCLSERRNCLWFLVARASSAWGGERTPQERFTMPGRYGLNVLTFCLICLSCLFFLPCVLGIKLRTSCMLGKSSASKLQPYAQYYVLDPYPKQVIHDKKPGPELYNW